jgi:hypothetical protein
MICTYDINLLELFYKKKEKTQMKRNISKYFLIAITINVTPHALEATAMQSGMQEIDHSHQWVTRVTVGPLPGGYSTAKITLPECNTVSVDDQQGGTFSLVTRINPSAEIFHYDERSPRKCAFLKVKFDDLPATGLSRLDIFNDMPDEAGDYRLEITFKKAWIATLSFVKEH